MCLVFDILNGIWVVSGLGGREFRRRPKIELGGWLNTAYQAVARSSSPGRFATTFPVIGTGPPRVLKRTQRMAAQLITGEMPKASMTVVRKVYVGNGMRWCLPGIEPGVRTKNDL